jgi:hypothetical protein
MNPVKFKKQPGVLDGLNFAALGILILFGLPGAMYYMLSSEMNEHEQFRKDGIVLNGVVKDSFGQLTGSRRAKTRVYHLTVECPSATPDNYSIDSGVDIAPGTPIKIRYSPTLKKARLEVGPMNDGEARVEVSTWQKVRDLSLFAGIGLMALGFGCYSLRNAYAYFTGNYVVLDD